VVGVVVVIITLLVSHKIAGPMFRSKQHLEEISRGNLQKKVHIRNGDQFDSVARNLNEMVVALNSRLRFLQEQLDELTERAKGENLPRSFQDDLEECRRTIHSNFQL
jgi:methyl-accepting chemotaxis protein